MNRTRVHDATHIDVRRDRQNVTPTVARDVAAVEAVRRELVAGADTVGPEEYNFGLSERRAESVVEAMVAGGVPAGAINSQAFGESNLAKPTPDEVDEVANRRVEIVIEISEQ